MEELLLDLDKDIQRCDHILIENNYLEIVIAVEELTDKYKSLIKGISTNNDKVWNYSKQDLIDIKTKLKIYKDQLILEENRQVLISIFEKTIKSVENNKELSKDKKNEVVNVLKNIELISNNKKHIYEKWNDLKKYILYSAEQSINISRDLINIINIILQIN